MYHFQSKYRSHDLAFENGKSAHFWNYALDTEDEQLAKKIRQSKSRDVWEVKPEDLIVTESGVTVPKKRGRPPKVVVGMRTVTETQGEKE